MQKRQIKVGNSALAVGSGDRSEGEEGVGSGGRKIFIQRLCTLAHFVVVPREAQARRKPSSWRLIPNFQFPNP